MDPELKRLSALMPQKKMIQYSLREDTPGGKLAELADVGG